MRLKATAFSYLLHPKNLKSIKGSRSESHFSLNDQMICCMFHPPIIVNWFGVFHLFPFHFRTRVICYVLHSQTRVVAQILLPLSYGWSYSPVRYFTLGAYGTPVPLRIFDFFFQNFRKFLDFKIFIVRKIFFEKVFSKLFFVFVNYMDIAT